MRCSCGSQDIDYQESSGNAICCSCGRIIEENTIVNSLEFEETGDRSHVVGQFVSVDGSKMSKSNPRYRNRSTNSEARSITLSNARRVIQQVASILRLPLLFVEKAHKMYSLALKQRFLFGRQQTHVVATCLYTVCRLEKSPHLLIDFSDALQVNVYSLGKTFIQFAKLLNLQHQLVVIDPALYIHRFGNRFNLGDKLNPVITTSLRIVTRMKKDWITTGRRPDSICAIAMLIAMRCHDIFKTQEEVSKVFRVHQSTLQRRLEEFRSIPTAQLTVQEFSAGNPLSCEPCDDGYDPPSFIRNNLSDQIDPEISDQKRGNSLSTIKNQAKIHMYETIKADLSIVKSDRPQLFAQYSYDTESAEYNGSVTDEELASYILSSEEQCKRTAIFDHCFKKLLEERELKKLGTQEVKEKGKKRKNAVDGSQTQNKLKRSQKINYEMMASDLNVSFAESVPDPVPYPERRTLKAGSAAKRINEKSNERKLDATNPNEVAMKQPELEEDDDLLYEEMDNYGDEYLYQDDYDT